MTGLKLLEQSAVENYVVIGGERTEMAAGHLRHDVACGHFSLAVTPRIPK